ncbi:transcription termination factor Rho [Tamaricihabitans halophyticus]|uniref:Transcription termination factor Rho n=1 Tax=Tamaricihabitans halophyticus TaxID=1262583 RepID=A0A4R2R622_9PSEU|nr:transcription termination factor Rho [Tamaricihabitans halophyticus]TCP54805.1 transcription termination factor Rho [Tamaricihabitans halophyticus]
MSNTDLLSGESATTDATEASASSGGKATGGAAKRRSGLSGMVLAELRELANQLGIKSTAGMRKTDLIAAIKEHQDKNQGRSRAETLPLDGVGEAPAKPARRRTTKTKSASTSEPTTPTGESQNGAVSTVADEAKPASSKNGTAAAAKSTAPSEQAGGGEAEGQDTERRDNRRRRSAGRAAGSTDGGSGQSGAGQGEQQRESRGGRQGDRNQGERSQGDRNQGDRNQGDRNQGDRNQGDRNQGGNRGQQNQQGGNRQNDEDDEDGGRRRGRRFRDRRRRGGGRGEGGTDTEIREDDVLLPVGGILDVLDNYAFVRTSGYLAGPEDVYVSLSLVRKYGLRRGDNVTGMIRQPREGEQQRQKFNPLVRVDSINGLDPDKARGRPEFTKLTPLYPNERLRLESESHQLTTRVIDLVMPIGKGQRALIVSPPKAGKTMILQSIANAITKNNPECHLMVVLADERPEEVTDMQRSVNGEVIASTFDRPPSDHTSVAELSIERAKRLVEMGHDVVVLLDSITRLGRAYNLAAPASGRILSGGVDSTALYPPKRFLGAARNIEGGGSLTIFATALVETGSTMDTVIFEEFKGTGNAELKLDRKIADKRIFPAVDVLQSSTRKEELLLAPDELAVTHKLRRVLHALDSQQAIDLLLDRLRKSKTNIEFLMQVSKTAPGQEDD